MAESPTQARFTLVADADPTTPSSAPSATDPRAAGETSHATKILLLSLAALSKRALIALADLFGLATVASVFWLWHSTPDPNVLQLIGLGMYAIFVAGVNVIVRRT
jgi:hypothetical protein